MRPEDVLCTTNQHQLLARKAVFSKGTHTTDTESESDGFSTGPTKVIYHNLLANLDFQDASGHLPMISHGPGEELILVEKPPMNRNQKKRGSRKDRGKTTRGKRGENGLV